MNDAANPDDLLVLALAALEAKDSYAAVELLSGHDPLVAAAVYEKAQLECYWQRKDLPAVVAISRAGIQHALSTAGQATDPGASQALRGTAKALAYNLASFTWPGWDEPDVPLSPADLAVGMDAARVNLRLAEELNRPAKGKANAFWVLGAHRLAAGGLTLAADAFTAAKSHAAQGGEALMERMLEGYLLLAELLGRPDDAGARGTFEAHVAALDEEGSEDGREYARQLATALKVFSQ